MEDLGIKTGGYGMIYECIWDSSLAESWEAVLTFMALVSIADADDNVYLDLERLHRKTAIPVEILGHGLQILLTPDPKSRTPEAGGRRITYLEGPETVGECRGFHVTNRAFYKRLLRKKYNSAYMSAKREMLRRGGNPTQVELSGKSRGKEAAQELKSFREDK